VNGQGGPTTLNVDTLDATPVKLADGVTDPTAADLASGRLYDVWYDGSAFRLMASGPSGAGAVSSVFGRSGSVTGQTGDYTAAQVTNAVDSTHSYNDPSWITALANSKITGLGGAALLSVGTAAGTVAAGDHVHAGVYEPVDATIIRSGGSYSNPAWITALAWSKLTGVPSTFNAGQLQGRTLASTAPTNLQYLGWNNGASQWEPQTLPAVPTIAGTTSVLKGDGDGNAAAAASGIDYQAPGNYVTALTGDVTAAGPGSAAASVVKVNGASVPASALAVGTNSSGQITAWMDSTWAESATCSSCGTSPSITGTDNVGVVTEGASATGCTISFSSSHSTPKCVVQSSTGLLFTYTVSSTGIVVVNAGMFSLSGGSFSIGPTVTGNPVLTYICEP
jgi:hypothetical protein